MLTLPHARTRGAFISFWLVICGMSGLLSVALSAILFSWNVALLTGGMFVLASFPVLGWPQIAYYPYRAWNEVLVPGFTKTAEWVLLSICFYMVLGSLGGARKSLNLHRPQPGQSVWSPRITQGPETYHGQDFTLYPSNHHSGWISGVKCWMIETKRYWALGLLPFLVLLSFLHKEEESVVHSDIYTLF